MKTINMISRLKYLLYPLHPLYKDIKALMADLKKVYAAIDEQTALAELENFDEKWGNKYPKIAIS